MNRCKTLLAVSAVLAAVTAVPAAAKPRTQTVTDPVGDTPYPSLDIVRTSLRTDARYVYVTIDTAARLLTTERFWPIVSIAAYPHDPDNFYEAYGANLRDGVFDQNGGPGNTTGRLWTHRSGRRSITYRFTREAIGNLSPFEWTVGTVAPDGQATDFTAVSVYQPR